MKKQKKTTEANIFLEHLFLVGWVQSLAQLHYYSLRLMDCALFRKEQLFHQPFSTLEVFLSITTTSEHFVTKHSARSPSIGKLPTLSCFPQNIARLFFSSLEESHWGCIKLLKKLKSVNSGECTPIHILFNHKYDHLWLKKIPFFLAVYKQTKFFWPYQLVESMGSVGTSKIRQIWF